MPLLGALWLVSSNLCLLDTQVYNAPSQLVDIVGPYAPVVDLGAGQHLYVPPSDTTTLEANRHNAKLRFVDHPA